MLLDQLQYILTSSIMPFHQRFVSLARFADANVVAGVAELKDRR